MYRESKAYFTKYRQLLNRALAYLRDIVNNTLYKTTETIKKEAATSSDNPSLTNLDKPMGSQAGKEIALYYIQYRAQCGSIKNLTQEIELRASSQQEYSVYLYDVLNCYHEQRRTLMLPIIDRTIGEILKRENILDLVRNGCSYMILICSEEEQLFRHLFTSDLATQSYRYVCVVLLFFVIHSNLA